MALSIQQGFLAQRNYPPYANNDPLVKLDIGVGGATSFSAPGAGFALAGSGATIDASLGLKTTYGQSGGLTSSTALTAMQSAAQGTIYCLVERKPISNDNSSLGGSFIDSVGHKDSDATGNGFMLHISGTSNALLLYWHQTGTNSYTLFCDVTFNGEVAQNNISVVGRMNNNYVDGLQDPQFCEVVFTWNRGAYYIYCDGHFMASGAFTAPPTTLFSAMAIGCAQGPSQPFGGYVKRVQFSTYFSGPVMGGPTVGIIGDSFTAEMRNTPAGGTTSTVAQINAVQVLNSLIARSGTFGYNQVFGQNFWQIILQSLAWQNLGFFFPSYGAGCNGTGWAKENNTNTIPITFADAIIQAQCEILIAFGSVNDVSSPLPATLGADAKAKLDYITAAKSGGTQTSGVYGAGVTQYPKTLRRILFFETFSWEGAANATNTPSYPSPSLFRAANAANAASLRAALEGQSSNGVPITYVPTYQQWAARADYNKCLIGTAPTNVSSQTDGHPSAYGRGVIAKIVWNELSKLFVSRPGR